jgi:hypothetical protein
VRDERVHFHPARHRALQGALQFQQVEAKDRDVDLFGGFLDGRNQRRQPILWLNDQLHALLQDFFFSVFHSTLVPGSGSIAINSAEMPSVLTSIGSWTK